MQTVQNAPEMPFHGDNTGSNPVGDAKSPHSQPATTKVWIATFVQPSRRSLLRVI